MRYLAGLALLGLVLCAGCARDRYTAAAVCTTPAEPPRPANLLLGPHPEDVYVAQQIGPRGNWPSVEHGYRFDDVTTYSRFHYDYETHFDRNGGLYREHESVRTGVWIR